MRNSLSLRFFFCMHECSPSISPLERPRFKSLGRGRGGNVNAISGKRSLGKVNRVGVVLPAGTVNLK